jgi:hypothetical protein
MDTMMGYGQAAATTKPETSTHYYLGLDLGQAQDFTAICIAERTELVRGNLAARPGATYQVRHLERPALGTPYPAIVARVRELVGRQPLRGQVTVVADATGVGAAVIDLLRDAHLDAPLYAVTITGGDTVKPGRAELPRAQAGSRGRLAGAAPDWAVEGRAGTRGCGNTCPRAT